MRRLLLVFSISLGLFTSVAILAAPQLSENRITLYKVPKLNAEVLEKVSSAQQLVPIYHRDQWIKVGDLQNGNVGWINSDQCCKIMEVCYQPNIRAVFICTELDGKDKSIINVVACENGKKLSKKEAQQLYERIRDQQIQESQYMQHFFRHVYNLIED